MPRLLSNRHWNSVRIPVSRFMELPRRRRRPASLTQLRLHINSSSKHGRQLTPVCPRRSTRSNGLASTPRLLTRALTKASLKTRFPGLKSEATQTENILDDLVPPVVTEPPKHRMHWVFIGPNGIRAGWGVLVFGLLYLVFLVFMGWVFRSDLLQVRHLSALSVRLGLIIEITQCLPAVLATWIMASIE